MNLSSSLWMQNPNVKLIMMVTGASLPIIIADLSADRVSWLTVCVVIANMLTTAKAFMIDPSQQPR